MREVGIENARKKLEASYVEGTLLHLLCQKSRKNNTSGTVGVSYDSKRDKWAAYIDLSKGTLINWNDKLAKALNPQLENIEKELLNSYYSNFDESSIKINGESYNQICASNKIHTRLWISKQKRHEYLEEIEFFLLFMGIIVKDGGRTATVPRRRFGNPLTRPGMKSTSARNT